MQYVKYKLVPGRNADELIAISDTFNGSVLYNYLTDEYIGTYDDTVDLSAVTLPEWVEIITETDYINIKNELFLDKKERTKNNIESYGKRKINEKYPYLNELSIDVSYAQNAIPGLVADGTKVDDVIINAVTVIQDPADLTSLNTAEDSIKNKTLDFSAYIPDTITDQSIIDSITNYYYKVAEGIVTYRKRRLVLEWIESKKEYIDGLDETGWNDMINSGEPIEDWFQTLVSDCPVI